MGVDVISENEGGKELETVYDSKRLFSPMISLALLRGQKLPLLQYVDEYGVTVFNQLQIPDFIAECTQLINTVETLDEKQFLEHAIIIAERAKGQPHVCIKLNGD